jgi:hypothetical protein
MDGSGLRAALAWTMAELDSQPQGFEAPGHKVLPVPFLTRIRNLVRAIKKKNYLDPMERVASVARHHAFSAEHLIAIAQFAAKNDVVFARCHPTAAAELPSIRPCKTIALEDISEIEIVIAAETMECWVLQVTIRFELMRKTTTPREKKCVENPQVIDETNTHQRLCRKRTWGWRVVDRQFFRKIETQLVTLGFVE